MIYIRQLAETLSFPKGICGSSETSYYIPISALKHATLIKSNDKKIVIYYYPNYAFSEIPGNERLHINKVMYNHFGNPFNKVGYFYNIPVVIGNYSVLTYINNEWIYVASLCLKSKKINSFKFDSSVDYSNLAFIKNMIFSENEDYKLLYNRIKLLISKQFANIDVIETVDFNNLCFNNPIKGLNFNTIDDLQNFKLKLKSW